MSAPLVYVYRLKIKCPVCRRVDGGCSVTKDRKRVLCWKVPSDEVTVNGHYWHTWPAVSDALTEEQIKALASARAETHADLAPIEKRDAVYRLLIESCALEERERQDLIRRGYAPDRIPSYFKSLPPIAHASHVTTEISERIGDLAGVPGFFASRVTRCGPCDASNDSRAPPSNCWPECSATIGRRLQTCSQAGRGRQGRGARPLLCKSLRMLLLSFVMSWKPATCRRTI